MNWVWQHSPTSGNQRLVLLALADACSRDDGTGCWPSVATVARKANISTRSVRRILGQLEAAGHLEVRRGAGPHGTNGYAIVLRTASKAPVDNAADLGQVVTPDSLSGVTAATAGADTGDRGGVTRLSPDPPKNHQEPPPPRPGRATRIATVNGELCGGGTAPGSPEETCANQIEGFLAELGPAWPLSSGQVRRLTPAIAAALADGWTPANLAEHVGANTAGVRNPYAVLTARLADLVRLPPTRSSPADRTVREAMTPACPHGDPRPGGCALCRRGIRPEETS
ncbi:UNVERIFIED_ORG: hypothetical protein FHR35_002704 [Microbispora rosea subsp. rosea]